ncbi:MAG TPA: 50S ribosomal protein L24 [Chloroflexi bacterium]|nr:50S ribosomal protein L24 [Chloroflexota bacterium]
MRKIKKGDTVEVIRGDHQGMRGSIHRVLPDKDQVIVSGVNIVKRHTKPTGRVRTQAGIIEREAPLRISNVALVCPHCSQRTKVAIQIRADGERVRVCKRCNEAIE